LSRSSRFFRIVWRANALLILVAAAGGVFSVLALLVSEVSSSMRARSPAAVAPAIVTKDSSEPLHLSGFSQIEGTTVYRAYLARASRPGYKLGSSGDSPENHNILLFDGSTGTTRWLLQGTTELIAYSEDLSGEDESGKSRPPFATVALIKPASSDPDAVDGRLLAFDITATSVRELATGVRAVDSASLTRSGEIAILFEQKRQYHLMRVDPKTFYPVSDHVLSIPPLK
jgi:hypothetical protein